MHYRYFLLYALVILIVGLLFIPLKWPQSRHLSFSQHVAKRKISILYYIGLFTATLPLLLLFFFGYFTPTIPVSQWFNAFALVSIVTQYACTFIPEVGGWKSTIHRSLAGISGLALLPCLAIILLSHVGVVSSLFIVAGLLTMLFCIFIATKAKGEPKNFLILQSVYFAAFFMPVLYVSYLQ